MSDQQDQGPIAKPVIEPESPSPSSPNVGGMTTMMKALIAAVVALVVVVGVASYFVVKMIKEERRQLAVALETEQVAGNTLPAPPVAAPGVQPVAGSTAPSPTPPATQPATTAVPAATVTPPPASSPSPLAAATPATSPAQPLPGGTAPAAATAPVPGATPASAAAPPPAAPGLTLPLSPQDLAAYPEPSQAVILFTTAEQNLNPTDMVGFYAPTVNWHGATATRDNLLAKHAGYLNKIASYHLMIGKPVQTYDGTGNWALVEYDVRGQIQYRSGKSADFFIRKRARLYKSDAGWKIDCEEDAAHYQNAAGPVTEFCHF